MSRSPELQRVYRMWERVLSDRGSDLTTMRDTVDEFYRANFRLAEDVEVEAVSILHQGCGLPPPPDAAAAFFISMQAAMPWDPPRPTPKWPVGLPAPLRPGSLCSTTGALRSTASRPPWTMPCWPTAGC